MARAKVAKQYRSFVRGLITEAGYLTYPENSSSDELNTVLSRKGNRTRRLGMNYEDRYVLNGVNNQEDFATNEFVWKAAAKNPSLNYAVIQTGNTISFFILDEAPISDGFQNFQINLLNYKLPSASNVQVWSEITQMDAGQGYLFLANPYCETLLVEISQNGLSVSVTPISILIRDFEGLEDGLPVDLEPTGLPKEHLYNLYNQSWTTASSPGNSGESSTSIEFAGSTYTVSNKYYMPTSFGGKEAVGYQKTFAEGPVSKFYNSLSRWPGNNKQWWVAKAEADDPDTGVSAGDFLPQVLDKTYFGNTRAPRGHYILNAFRKDRTRVSGISGLPVVEINQRPNSVAFFSGRVWYGCQSSVYYSQILDTKYKAGLCYQEADPTSEDISDLIQSDGGMIPIPEANKIIRLIPLANGIVVFALNGVWFISGGGSGFTATDISVDKISSIGTKSPMAIVAVDSQIFWWSEIGIQAIAQESGAFGPIPGKFGNTNLTEQTIQSFYNAIDASCLPFVKAVYDPSNNLIQWLYRDEEVSLDYRYNRILIYDITLQAFYPWKISSIENGPLISGVVLDTGQSTNEYLDQIIDITGQTVVNNSLDNLVISVYNISVRPTSLAYVTMIGDAITFSKLNDFQYVDWREFDDVGAEYDSYVETGYELLDDAMRNKQATYISVYTRKTEEDEPSVESSCKFRTKWEWSDKVASNRWSREVECYRTTVREGLPVIVSKNKVRGSGKALQFRFGTSSRGKTFDLLGWSAVFTGNTEP